MRRKYHFHGGSAVRREAQPGRIDDGLLNSDLRGVDVHLLTVACNASKRLLLFGISVDPNVALYVAPCLAPCHSKIHQNSAEFAHQSGNTRILCTFALISLQYSDDHIPTCYPCDTQAGIWRNAQEHYRTCLCHPCPIHLQTIMVELQRLTCQNVHEGGLSSSTYTH